MLDSRLKTLRRAMLGVVLPCLAVTWLATNCAFGQEIAPGPYRRVDLGNGLWRVEATPKQPETLPETPQAAPTSPSDEPLPPPIELPGDTWESNHAVVKQMLGEARDCLARDDFAGARRLLQWIHTLDGDNGPSTASNPLRSELHMLELEISSSEMMSRLRAKEQELAKPMPLATTQTGPADLAPAATLAEPVDLPTDPLPSASEERTEESDAPNTVAPVTWDASLQTIGSQTDASLTSTLTQPPRLEAMGTAPPASLLLPIGDNTLAVFLIIAGGILLFMLVLAVMMFRRITMLDQETARLALAASQMHLADVSATAARPLHAVEPGPSVSETTQQAPAAAVQSKPPTWEPTISFADKKQAVDSQRKEAESEMIRQIVAQNLSLRKQFDAKKAA